MIRTCTIQSPGRRGFTFIEVLATLMLIGIVLPTILSGIELSTGAGTRARQRTEAAGLAESKLNEVIVTQQWQSGVLAGDFAPDWPNYQWQATVQNWPQDQTGAGIQEVDLKVTWQAGGGTNSVTLSTLIYNRTSSTQ